MFEAPLETKSVAIVGVSDASFYGRLFIENLTGYGYTGDIFPVHPRATSVLGIPAHPSVDDLPHPPDLAVVALSAAKSVPVIERLGRLGCPQVILVSDGFRETAEAEGERLQTELVEVCRRHDIDLIGPQSLGFADFAAGVVAIGAPMPTGVSAGGVSLVTQSGALMSGMLDALEVEGVGVDVCVNIGNGAVMDVVDVMESILARPTTTVLCGYVEGFGSDVRRVAAVLERARRGGKHVVLIKSGGSEISRRLAASHTATIAGPDQFVQALFDRQGVIRVNDVAEMVRIAHLCQVVGGLDAGRGLAVVTSSGGGAAIAGDLAERNGVAMAELADTTLSRLRELVPSSGFVGNPMDITGRGIGGSEIGAEIYDAVFTDESVAAVLYCFGPTWPDDSEVRAGHREHFELMARKAAEHGKPVIVNAIAFQSRTTWVDQYAARTGAVVLDGLDQTMSALGRLSASVRSRPEPHTPGQAATALSEAAGRELLATAGVAVVPGGEAATLDDVPATAAQVGFPAVVKGAVSGVSHKAALGAVVLGVCTPEHARAAAETIRAAVAERAPRSARLEGFIVERMVSGVELIVGLERESRYGATLTVGVGGALSESVPAHATALLPLAGDDEVDDLFHRARLGRWHDRLPETVRETLRTALGRVAAEFLDGSLTPFDTVEVNPLFVTQAGEVLAGDVLIIPRTDGDEALTEGETR